MLKEAWLFGKLQTVGTTAEDKRAEDATQKLIQGIARLRAEGAFDARGDTVMGEPELKGGGEPG